LFVTDWIASLRSQRRPLSVIARNEVMRHPSFARHQSQVRIFLRKLSRDYVLADDLAQDAFLQTWNKLHTFSGKEKVRERFGIEDHKYG
jgi:hypothetical protein